MHAQAQFGDASKPEAEADSGMVDIGYPLALAFDLWMAWKEHHTLPRAGGYLDQPRRWQRMIGLMNRRYNPLYEQAREAHYPPGDASDAEDDGGVLADIMGHPSPFADSAPASWERFKGTS